MELMLLAIFPLQLALFPGEALPLHIFEPRYRQLIADCRDSGIHFGIPTATQGNLSAYGTEVELVEILKTYDTGEMDIVVRGLRVFHILEVQGEVPGKLYSGAQVEYPADVPEEDEGVRTRLVEKFFELHRVLGQPKPDFSDAPFGLSYRIARDAGLTLGQRVELLSKPAERDRQAYLLEHVERALKNLREQSGPKTLARGNGKSHAGGNGHAKS